MGTCCDSKEILRENSIKVTRQRLELLEKILSMDTMFTAQKLHETLIDSMDLATIYRIIQVFLEKSIIREVYGSNETKLYELSCSHNPVHPHLQCNICSELICLPAIEGSTLNSLINHYSNIRIDDISLHLTGICEKCRGKI